MGAYPGLHAASCYSFLVCCLTVLFGIDFHQIVRKSDRKYCLARFTQVSQTDRGDLTYHLFCHLIVNPKSTNFNFIKLTDAHHTRTLLATILSDINAHDNNKYTNEQ